MLLSKKIFFSGTKKDFEQLFPTRHRDVRRAAVCLCSKLLLFVSQQRNNTSTSSRQPTKMTMVVRFVCSLLLLSSLVLVLAAPCPDVLVPGTQPCEFSSGTSTLFSLTGGTVTVSLCGTNGGGFASGIPYNGGSGACFSVTVYARPGTNNLEVFLGATKNCVDRTFVGMETYTTCGANLGAELRASFSIETYLLSPGEVAAAA
jgi:hypothetical protein